MFSPLNLGQTNTSAAGTTTNMKKFARDIREFVEPERVEKKKWSFWSRRAVAESNALNLTQIDKPAPLCLIEHGRRDLCVCDHSGVGRNFSFKLVVLGPVLRHRRSPFKSRRQMVAEWGSRFLEA